MIDDIRGLELFRQLETLSEDDAAMLHLWLFHRRPPTELTVFVDKSYLYGFSEYGVRLGLVDFNSCPGDNLYFEGDNNVSYIGSRVEGSNICFFVKVMECSRSIVENKCEKFLDLCSMNL